MVAWPNYLSLSSVQSRGSTKLSLLISSYLTPAQKSQQGAQSPAIPVMRRRDSFHQKKAKRGIRDRALYSSYRRGEGCGGV